MKPKTFLDRFGSASRPPARPILLLGPPGIGKSETVRQLAQALASRLGLEFREWSQGMEIDPSKHFVFVEFRLSGTRDVDLLGLPNVIADPSAETFSYRVPEWLSVLARSGQRGMLFVDEITNPASDDVKAVLMQLLGSRRIGFVKLSPGIWIVAAGNRPEHSVLASELAAPVVNRLRIIEFEAPNVSEWVEFMTSHYDLSDRSRPVFAFLTAKPDFLVTETVSESSLEPYPTPRAWTGFILDLESGLANYDDVDQYVGSEAGAAFRSFMSYRIDVGRALSDIDYFKSLEFDQQLYVIGMAKADKLADWITSVGIKDGEVMELAVVAIRFLPAKARARAVREIMRLARKDKRLRSVLSELVGGA